MSEPQNNSQDASPLQGQISPSVPRHAPVLTGNECRRPFRGQLVPCHFYMYIKLALKFNKKEGLVEKIGLRGCASCHRSSKRHLLSFSQRPLCKLCIIKLKDFGLEPCQEKMR